MSNGIEIQPGIQPPQDQLTGELLLSMFLSMAYNIKHRIPGVSNWDYLEELNKHLPQTESSRFADSKLRLKVASFVAGSIIMRHGARPYLDQLEDGCPTVTGIVTSINITTASFCVDPGEGKPNKDREVSVIPIDHWSMQPNVSIDILSIG